VTKAWANTRTSYLPRTAWRWGHPAIQAAACAVSVQSNHIVLACAPASALFDALAAGTIAGAGLDVHRLELRQARDRFAALPKWS
jgi:hypothetical protein